MNRTELNLIKETLRKGGLLDGISVDERPDSGKVGYILSPVVFDATHIGWEYVKDPDYEAPAAAGGTYTSPAEYHIGDSVKKYTDPDPFTGDGWYVYDDLVKICIKDGTPVDFDDAEYFAFDAS